MAIGLPIQRNKIKRASKEKWLPSNDTIDGLRKAEERPFPPLCVFVCIMLRAKDENLESA